MERLARRYLLAERLGEGGGGTVWRARDEVLNRDVAIKQVRVSARLGPEERVRFTERAIYEARTAGRLNHPAIVAVHDVIDHGGEPWIVMDLIIGRSLDRVVKEQGPLPERRVAAIGLAVLGALEAAHARGVLHRDVKPGNVLLDGEGRAMLADFGIAAPMGGTGDQGTIGSPGFMAPERLRGEEEGAQSDLWSLGATLYTAAEGRTPFHRDIPAAIAAAVLMHEPPAPVRVGPVMARLLVAMLAKEPAHRPSPHAVRHALQGLASSHVAEPPTRPVRRGRTRALIGGGVAVAVVAGTAATLWFGGRDDADPHPGRYSSSVEACGLLTEAYFKTLTATDRVSKAGTAGTCEWADRYGGLVQHSLALRTKIPPDSQGAGGAAVASEALAAEREKIDPAPESVQGVADEAFSYDIVDGKTGLAGTTVWVRISNLLVEVDYRERAGKVSQDMRTKARRAASQVAVEQGWVPSSANPQET